MDFDNIAEKAKDGFEIVKRTTEKTVTVYKLKFEIASLENKISKSYEELGRLVYLADKKGEAVDEAYIRPVIDGITKKKEQIKKLREMINKAENKD